jgi:hypothetical protein
MAIRTILSRFREICTITSTEFSDGSVTNYAEPVELAFFNEVMDETLTITSHTTGDDFADEILSWLVASFAYQEKYRQKYHKDSGLLEWEWLEQQALKLMYARNPTKIEFNSNNGIYIIRNPDVTSVAFKNLVLYDSSTLQYQYGD